MTSYVDMLSVPPHALTHPHSPTPFNPHRAHDQRAAEIHFEQFGISRFFVNSCGNLSLYANGRQNAVIVDCGHGATDVMPFMYFDIFSSQATQIPLGGLWWPRRQQGGGARGGRDAATQ